MVDYWRMWKGGSRADSASAALYPKHAHRLCSRCRSIIVDGEWNLALRAQFIETVAP